MRRIHLFYVKFADRSLFIVSVFVYHVSLFLYIVNKSSIFNIFYMFRPNKGDQSNIWLIEFESLFVFQVFVVAKTI